MKIDINNHRKIFAIQKEFNDVYPTVNIEFYKKQNANHGHSTSVLVRSKNKTLEDCRTEQENGAITISNNMTVGELKDVFCNVYGLTVDIFQDKTNAFNVPLAAEGNVILSTLN